MDLQNNAPFVHVEVFFFVI